jgi:uncharacterized protein with HEPN domain
MLEAATSIESYTSRGRDSFEADPAIRDAILYQIVILGEAAKTLVKADAALAAELSEVEWSLLSRMRDHVAHRYWETDHEIVWNTATKDIPDLRLSLSAAIDRLA